MKLSHTKVLRFGLGVTFIWIGVLILGAPEAWGFMMQPWAKALLPVSLKLTMQVTAWMDIAVGLMLLFNLWTWVAALLCFSHLLTVLITVGVNESTVRDIGLGAASLALAMETLPASVAAKLRSKNK